MPCRSSKHQITRDLEILLIFTSDITTEDSLLAMLGLSLILSLGGIVCPDDPKLREFLDLVFGKEEDIFSLLCHILEACYLQVRQNPQQTEAFSIKALFSLQDNDFKQLVRKSKAGFLNLYQQISGHEIFTNNSHNPQMPVAHQMALLLERLGSNGNGASVGKMVCSLEVGQGTVIKCTWQVLATILSLRIEYLSWPKADWHKQISPVLSLDGFPSCVGFVDKTSFPIHQRLGKDREVFHDCKKRYSVNAQIICNCDRRIIGVLTGWPGSCADTTVFQKMAVSQNPSKFFSSGEYLLADSADGLTEHCIPSYKKPLADLSHNADFNFVVAKAQVQNKHCIGNLKGCWASLQELWMQLFEKEHMEHCIDWFMGCILHNMLAQLGDAWGEQCEDDQIFNVQSVLGSNNGHGTPTEWAREALRDHSVAYNYIHQ